MLTVRNFPDVMCVVPVFLSEFRTVFFSEFRSILRNFAEFRESTSVDRTPVTWYTANRLTLLVVYQRRGDSFYCIAEVALVMKFRI
jgi:hypothetical protein